MATCDNMATAIKEHSLADIVRDIGYAFTASVEECKNNMLKFGAREPTTLDVAKTISMMVRYRTTFQDGLQIQTPGNFWMNHENDTIPHGMGEWNAEVFVQTLKDQAPTLDWKEVILQLDHQEFIVPNRAALSLLFTILRLGLQSAGYPPNTFPVEYLCRHWTNMDGQISLIRNILTYPDIFNFANHPYHQVSIDLLKSSPEADDKEVGTWRSLYLVELLLYASEHGYYVIVTELLKTPLQHCPDVLLLVLLQIDPPLTPVRQELMSKLIQIFFGNHPNSAIILHRAWHTQHLNVKSIIAHAMSDWYLRGECDQSKLSRLLDIAQDLKGLSLLLKMQSFPFTIDFACLASRRKYLNLDKWLTDKIRDHDEAFVTALVKFLHRRCQIVLSNQRMEDQQAKTAQLPQETIATLLTCLKMCIPNVQKELQEAINNVIADCQMLMVDKLGPTRVLETPFDPTGFGAQLFSPRVDSMSALTPKIANMSLSGPTNTTLSMPDTLGLMATTPGSPSSLMGVNANSPFSMMPLVYHNSNMADIRLMSGIVPPPTQEKPRIQDSNIFPDVKVGKDIEDEANGYFQKIYNYPLHPSLTIDEVLEMLKKFQDSAIKKEREIFSYMIQNVFEEYKFFPEYPDKELHITAQFFGGIIANGLAPSYVSLGLALRFILDALKKGEGTKMYYFGIAALDRFKSRLKDYHKYCEHIRVIPYFDKFPPHLIEYVEYGLQSQEPPTKPQGPVLPTPLAAMVNQNSVVGNRFRDFFHRSVVSTSSMSEMTTSGSVSSRPSVANVTNIDSLLTAAEDQEKILAPPEAIQDKTAFIFNNLSQLNLQTKCAELKEIVTEEYFPWLSRYLVMKRVSIESNFHGLYSNFLDVLEEEEMNKMVTEETYRNIKVLLRSDKRILNYTDRSLLKNLGHWLGLLTLGRNVPILKMDIDLKMMVLEAYHKGRQELLSVVPFVAKVVLACAKSDVFKPPNPWTMSIMVVLAELHQEPNLELNLKFEVEVLCKNLNLDIADVTPSVYLRDPEAVQTITFQLSSQPMKQQQKAVAAAMPVQQTMAHQMQMPPPTPMMQPDDPTPTDLAPNNPALVGGLGLPEPRFNYLDINVSSTTFGQNLSFNPHILLFQNYPHLKHVVKPAIERSIQEWIHPVVDRAIKYAMTTCEMIIRKDFALDPDDLRMRTCAHHMLRNLTAGIAMITCREQIITTISTNLKAAFTGALMPAAIQQDAIESAAAVLATDNMELACVYIQKTAVDKALPELDKRLMPDYEARKQAREDGRRYYDPGALAYQTELLPERFRLRVGGPTDLQLSVYEELARHIPGFAPVKDPSLLAPKPVPEAQMLQQLPYSQGMNPVQASTDEMSSLIAAAEMFASSCVAPRLASNMRALLECLLVARRNRDIVSGCALLQKAVEGILSGVPAGQSPDAARYRDIHLRVLKLLEDARVYGHVWTSKQITCCLAECREDIRYNIEAVDCIVRNRLINMPQYDLALAQMMDNGNNFPAVAFAMQFVQLYLVNDRNNLVAESELCHTTEILARVTQARQPEVPPVAEARAGQEAGAVGGERPFGPTAHIHSGIIQVRSQSYDDPPGLKEKTESFFREWNNVLHSPLTELNLQQNFNLYIHRMTMTRIFESDDLVTRFFRIATQICIENVYQLIVEDGMIPSQSPARRQRYYVMCDSFTKLVSLMIKNMSDGNNTSRLNLLNKVLGIIAGCLLQDQDSRRAHSHQLPCHRMLIMLFLDMNVAEPVLESINFQVLTAFCHTLHIIRPAVAPGFCYAWLEIIGNRVFIERVLAHTPQQRGWGMYSTLLIDLFKFLAPFLCNNEPAPPVMKMYQGTLKLLLVILHDFPEFLCDYHYGFCDVIPPNCIQLRNLILSAFPRNMRLPDPVTPNLKVDLLPEIALSPRSVVNYATILPNSQFKTDLDAYLQARAPVTFLSELRSHMQVTNEPGRRYNSQLMNSVVLYVGTQAIASIRSKGHTPSMATIAHSANMDIFQNFTVDFDCEGRYLFLNAVANQLRYPNSHTHYFSCVLLHLFAEANSDEIQVQITRMLLERLIVNRPHPWGLLVTFIELIKNPVYNFRQHELIQSTAEKANDATLPPLYNYIVEQVIAKISGRRDVPLPPI